MIPATEDDIKHCVAKWNGLKGIELPSRLAEDGYTLDWHSVDLKSMVGRGELVEVEYVLPHMDERVKSFYLPKGTEVRGS